MINITKSNILRLFLLVTVVVMEVNISLQQHCPTAINSQHGYALIGSEYKSFTSMDYAKCMMECEVDDRCMSLNFLLTTKTCDLNTQTKESTPRCLQPRENSVYTRSMAFRTPKFPKSCRDILASCKLQESGEYWIEPDQGGGPIRVLCDMTTDGGGWTVVKNSILQDSQVPPRQEFSTYEVLQAYNMTHVNVRPSSSAMLDIKNKMGFHQIHFYCHKVNVGRVVNIMTKNNTAGQDVVRFFTDDVYASSTFPDACGSFDRLPEDTSVLSQNCEKWGVDAQGRTEVNKWGFSYGGRSLRLDGLPFLMVSNQVHHYGLYFDSGGSHCLCDDAYALPEPCSANDTWLISVR